MKIKLIITAIILTTLSIYACLNSDEYNLITSLFLGFIAVFSVAAAISYNKIK
mgnify:CR=1 FL=1